MEFIYKVADRELLSECFSLLGKELPKSLATRLEAGRRRASAGTVTVVRGEDGPPWFVQGVEWDDMSADPTKPPAEKISMDEALAEVSFTSLEDQQLSARGIHTTAHRLQELVRSDDITDPVPVLGRAARVVIDAYAAVDLAGFTASDLADAIHEIVESTTPPPEPPQPGDVVRVNDGLGQVNALQRVKYPGVKSLRNGALCVVVGPLGHDTSSVLSLGVLEPEYWMVSDRCLEIVTRAKDITSS